MKKHYACLTIWLFTLPLASNAQLAVQDALTLRSMMIKGPTGAYEFNPDAINSVYGILGKYTPVSNQTDDHQIHQGYDENPFLGGDSLQGAIQLPPKNDRSVPFSVAPAIASSSGILSLNVTNIVDGTAQFLVERAEQELNIAFFSKFQNQLDKHPAFKKLFPQTAQTLSTIGTNIYRYQQFISALQGSFQRDLKSLPMHLANLLEDPTYNAWIKNDVLKVLLPDLLISANMTMDGDHPGQILDFWGQKVQFPDSLLKKHHVLQNFLSSMQVTDVISNALRADSSQVNYWVTSLESRDIFADTVTFKLFLGLVYQKAQNIPFVGAKGDTMTFGTMLHTAENYAEKVALISKTLRGLILRANQIDFLLQDYAHGDTITANEFYQVTNNLLHMMRSGYSMISELKTLTGGEALSSESKFLSSLSMLNSINLDIRQSQYAQGVVTLTALLDTLMGPKFTFGPEILKYGTFMANVATADSASEVKAALQSAALPVGSSAVKKNSAFNIAFQAYLGGTFGRETLFYPVGNNSHRDTVHNIFAVSAPIGISVSWGLGKAGSISLFGSIVDIGAVTAFRFQDDSTQNLPQISLRNIIAPGGYLVYGVPNLPVAIGAGLQHGPELRKVTSTTLGVEALSGWRWGIFASVDIPLFNLATVPRK